MAVPSTEVLLISVDGFSTYDVTSYVKSVSVDRGRSRELDKFEAGTFTIAFENRLRYFDPQYTDSTTRTNLVKNPVPDFPGPAVSPQESWQLLNRGTGGAGTTTIGSGGAVDVVTTAASTTAYSFGLTGGSTAQRIAVTAGQTYAISFYAISSINDVRRLAATFYDAGGSSLGDVTVGVAQSMTAGIEMRFTGTYTAPAGAVSMRIYAGATTGSVIRTLGSTMTWRKALVEQTSTIGTYFSGDDVDNNYQTFSWTGTAEASTSTLLEYATPFYGLIVPNVGVQITTEGYGRIYGFIKDWNLMYDVSGESTAVATGADAFSFLANQTTSSALSPAEQTAGNRIGYVLGQPDVEWPYGGPNWSLDTTGTSLVQSHTIDAGTNILEYAQLVERTENGFFFVNQSGVIEFQKNGYDLQNDVVFTDDGSDIPYQGVEIIYGSELLYNTISLTRLGGAKKTASRPVSIAAYGNSVYEDDGLLYVDDTATLAAAEDLAVKYSTPEYRFDSVTVFLNPLSNADQQRVLSIDLAQILQVSFTPNSIGSAITKYVRVIGVSEKMDVDGHTVTFKLATIENEIFTLDSDIFGLLDYNVLGF
jgi:hypothetical protein